MIGFLGQMITVGAHAVGLATHVTPATRGNDLTEVYLTQPALMAHARAGQFSFSGMLNLEGLTLQRGELNAGVWGEGYVDRRHPHTYLHEAIFTFETQMIGSRFSLSTGKGFAPFGSDDPMIRPFVKYPSNHHLAQVLERLVVIGAVNVGAVIVEGGLFNGNEPSHPKDVGDFNALGDSWSTRLSLLPASGIEISGSYAEVNSPETPGGGGLDHEMWHASARASRRFRSIVGYFLIEHGEVREGQNGVNFFTYRTFLAEAAATHGAWRLAGRFERSLRPEEERTTNPFRAVRPHHDNSILGRTRWVSSTVQISRSMTFDKLELLPFVEVAHSNADALEQFPVVEPESHFGSANMWSFSFGIRSTIGTWHNRMGRYGAARVAEHAHTH